MKTEIASKRPPRNLHLKFISNYGEKVKNRQVKCRAWDSKKNEWVKLENILLSLSPQDGTVRAFDIGGNYELQLSWSTGLHDKNDEEIYEDDLVVVLYADNRNGRKIAWGDLGWCMEPVYEPRSLYELWERERLEVIGNMYQNPELFPTHCAS